MLLQVGVKVLLKNTEDKYLLLKRNPEKYKGLNVWDIPGGRIEPGSSLYENLKREVKEETGLSLDEVNFLSAQDILKPDLHVVRLTYIGEASGEILLSEEHTEAKWFLKEEIALLKENLDPYLAELIHKF